MHDRSLRPVAVGLAGGLASGLLGVGGGIVMVPLLLVWMRTDQRMAHAVSLAAIVPIAVIGSALFLIDGEVDLPLAGLLAAGGIAGASVGVRLLDRIPEPVLRLLFSGLALVAGVRMLVG